MHARTYTLTHKKNFKKTTGRDIIQNKDVRAHIDTPPGTLTGTQRILTHHQAHSLAHSAY